MGDLAKIQDALTADGLGLAAISVDPLDESKDLASRLGVQFPLLSDPQGQVINAYGVMMQGQTLAIPATFVVNEDRNIVWKHVGETVPDRPATEIVREQATKSRRQIAP